MAPTTVPENLTREQCIFMAKLAEQSERYDDMLKLIQNFITITPPPPTELTVEERNLLNDAYRKVAGSLRTSWFNLTAIEHKLCSSRKKQVLKDYRFKVERELTDLCYEILNFLDSNLIDSASSSESKVFYLKMKGDYFRYLAGIKIGDERTEAVDAAMNSYKAAQDIAQAELGPAHLIRLGVALNFSVFYSDIMKSTEMACSIAEQAFEEAVDELDNLSEDMYKESYLIMQLLRDNVAVWTSDPLGTAPYVS
ncbi:14-3-3-like protein D [Rutidosis leptorrhynchoides]|uniref:14-3-3-like protein D n=1 Tax=Rutidosis leptorrhynchoides TaxID=125765 RepID=UPI003A99574D